MQKKSEEVTGMAKAIEKHITFYEMHDQVLKKIMETEPTVQNYSEAIRFLCMNYDPETEKNDRGESTQLNAIGKELSVLTEMVSEFADLHLKETGILIGKNSVVYHEAKERVEEQIKSNQTKKYSLKTKKTTTEPTMPKTETFDPTSFLKR